MKSRLPVMLILFFMALHINFVQAHETYPRVDSDGINELIEQEKGQVVLLNFWATWCAPCRAEILELIKIREMYSHDDLTIIGPSLDFDPSVISPFVERIGLNYKVVHALDQVMNDYEIERIPYTLIFDRSGNKSHEFYELVETEILIEIIEELIKNGS